MITKYDLENNLSYFMTPEEERKYFDEVCSRIISNPRFYLDHLDELYVFRVSFLDYHDNKRSKRGLKRTKKNKGL